MGQIEIEGEGVLTKWAKVEARFVCKQTASTADNMAASYLHDTPCLNASAREILGRKWRNTGWNTEKYCVSNGEILFTKWRNTGSQVKCSKD